MSRAKSPAVSQAGVAAAILFFWAGILGYVHLRTSGVDDSISLLLVLGIPAAATVMFMLLTWLVPNLIATGKLIFPVTLTLPIIYAILIVVAVIFSTSTGNSLVRPSEAFAVLAIWTNPVALLLMIVGQFVSLTFAGKLAR